MTADSCVAPGAAPDRIRGRRRSSSPLRLSVLALAGGLLLAGCGTGSQQVTAAAPPMPTHGASATSMLTVITLPKLGHVVADGSGHVLYMFPPDARLRVSCTSECADDWPPEDLSTGTTAAAGPGVDAKLIGTLPDPNTGKRVITYAGQPLYRYIGDPDPHMANGQAMVDDGGPWYVLAPDGQPVTASPNREP